MRGKGHISVLKEQSPKCSHCVFFRFVFCVFDLKAKAKRALKVVIQKVVSLDALEPLLNDAPLEILKYIIAQYAKVLPHDATARRNFVTSGGLRKIQDIVTSGGEQNEALADYIQTINNCYPEEIVRYYTPGYSESILEKVDNYVPTISA